MPSLTWQQQHRGEFGEDLWVNTPIPVKKRNRVSADHKATGSLFCLSR